jgi:DNA polymerase III subunit gamma/tau
MARMEFIAHAEGIEADKDTLAVIAQVGEGSVRDSLSALDQAIACCGKTLRVEDVRALLGVFAVDTLQAVAVAVLEQDGRRMLEIVQDLERSGQSLQHYVRELSRYWRNLLVAKIEGKATALIAASDREQDTLLKTAAQFSEEDLTRYLSLTLELFKAMQVSLQPRLHLELGLIKLVQAGRLQSIEEAIANLGGGSGSESSGRTSPALQTATKPPSTRPALFETWTAVPRPAPEPDPHAGVVISAPPAIAPRPPQPVASVAAPSAAPSAALTGDWKTDLHNALKTAGLNFSADAIVQADVNLAGSELKIRAPKFYLIALRDPGLARIATELAGRPIKVTVEAGEMAVTAPSPAGIPKIENTEFAERALSHPGVKKFQELFPDSQVRTVRNLNE